MIILKLLYVVE